jgi:hypothetical protein
MTLDNYEHYNYKYKHIKIDPYRIMFEYKITHPAHQHAVKKLLRCGKSIKEQKRDIKEVIDSLTRWLEMIEEDEPSKPVEKQKVINCSTCKHDKRDGGCHKTTTPHSFDCWPVGYVGWEEKT